jgi:beta-galactosidase
MRRLVPFSSGWEFARSTRRSAAETQWIAVDLPHSFVELPLEHFDDKSYQFTGTYRKSFDPGDIPAGGSLWIDFEGVSVSCDVFVNGAAVGSHPGPYTPFSFEIGSFLRADGLNLVEVEVDGSESPGIPPFGGVVDYLAYAGIYRGVWLRVQDRLRLEDFHARPRYADGKAGLSISATIARDIIAGGAPGGVSLKPEDYLVEALLAREGQEIARASARSSLAAATGEASIVFPELAGIAPWDLDKPVLYELELRLYSDGQLLDADARRIGFREARFTPEGFFLNGKKVFLKGLNRHQSWPYAGYAMGPGSQRADAEILKRELDLNMVRTSHYPQSRHFLDACDELGLLVMEELPGWQHIGDKAWQDRALADLEAMIKRDRNRPSIVLWGVRINESADSPEFYAATNRLASRLDPDRQRGGVRNFARSEFLEDVYTYNDFSFDGKGRGVARARRIAGGKRPYLITEHTGHMYPAKRRDGEERQAEHARRHARVLDAAAGEPGVSGAIGWCAFDYATHKEFGSPGKICHHGVMDSFRLPKFAAALYASQIDPGTRIVLEPASWFSVGERSALCTLPVEVYTNCDEIKLYRAGQFVGSFFPDRAEYPHLEHPPVIIDDFIGHRIDAEGFSAANRNAFLELASKAMTKGFGNFNIAEKLKAGLFLVRTGLSVSAVQELVCRYGYNWAPGDSPLELVGFIKGREAIRRGFDPGSVAVKMELAIDAPRLTYLPGDEWNAVRAVVRILDGAGNICPSVYEPVAVEVSGAARLLGPASISLAAGCAAFWIATTGKPGEANITVRSHRFGDATAVATCMEAAYERYR